MIAGKLPPGPPLPAAAQLLAWLYQPARFFDACHARYGDVFTMHLPGNAPRVMLARHPEIRQVFTGDPACLHAGAANALVAPLVGPRSVLILDGAPHQRQRRLLLSLFNGRKAAEHGRTMRALADEMIDRWPVGRPFSLGPEMQSLTLRIIIATIFGARDVDERAALFALLTDLLEAAKNPLLLAPALQRDLGPLTPWRRFQGYLAQLDDMLAPLAARRRADPGDDLLSQLVAATDEDGRPLSDRQIRDDLVTLLVAGHETTANALAWTTFHTLHDPAVHDRARAELATVVGDAPVGPEHLDALTWLGAIIDEGLRINPVLAHVGRQLTAPMTVGGHDLPAGCMVVPNIYLAHRDPALYPDPDRFDPSRFTGERPSPQGYLPFGGGARRCIGMAFALQEMKIVLGTVLQRTDLALSPDARPGVQRRGVVWSPAGAVPVLQRRAPTTG